MNDLSLYHAAIKLFRPGDAIVFWGSSFFPSRLIEAETRGPSHIAMVRWAAGFDQTGVVIRDVTITESTISDRHSGPQTNSLKETILSYPEGSAIGLLRLDAERHATFTHNLDKFYAEVGQYDNTDIGYDKVGLVGFLLRQLPLLGGRLMQAEDPKDLFCSGYCSELYEAAKVLLGFNSRQTDPLKLCQVKMWEPTIIQLTEQAIPKMPMFNSV